HVDARLETLGGRPADLPWRAEPDLHREQDDGSEAVELGGPQRDADHGAERLDEVERARDAPAEIVERDGERGGQEWALNGPLPASPPREMSERKQHEAGDERDGGEVRPERSEVEGQQERQRLVETPCLPERERLVEPEPVVQVGGRVLLDECPRPQLAQLVI